MCASKQRRRGFTLVEILTVVVIIGIASAIIVPQIASSNDLKARAGARVVMADLMYAQNLAISLQKWHYVKFDVPNNRYSMLDSVPLSGGDNIVTHPINKAPFTVQFGPGSQLEEVSIDSATFNGVDATYRPEFTIAFDELGTPWVYCYDDDVRNEMLDGNAVISSGPVSLTVTIERYTGEIKVQ